MFCFLVVVRIPHFPSEPVSVAKGRKRNGLDRKEKEKQRESEAWCQGGQLVVEPAARRRLKSDTCTTSTGRREGGEREKGENMQDLS